MILGVFGGFWKDLAWIMGDLAWWILGASWGILEEFRRVFVRILRGFWGVSVDFGWILEGS